MNPFDVILGLMVVTVILTTVTVASSAGSPEKWSFQSFENGILKVKWKQGLLRWSYQLRPPIEFLNLSPAEMVNQCDRFRWYYLNGELAKSYGVRKGIKEALIYGRDMGLLPEKEPALDERWTKKAKRNRLST